MFVRNLVISSQRSNHFLPSTIGCLSGWQCLMAVLTPFLINSIGFQKSLVELVLWFLRRMCLINVPQEHLHILRSLLQFSDFACQFLQQVIFVGLRLRLLLLLLLLLHPENYVSYCLYMQITLFTFLITVEKYVRVIEPNEVNQLFINQRQAELYKQLIVRFNNFLISQQRRFPIEISL